MRSNRARTIKRIVALGAFGVSSAAFALWMFPRVAHYNRVMKPPPLTEHEVNLNARVISGVLPSRSYQMEALKRPGHVYDVLVIGGGATGCGVTLDASTRGLDVAQVEKFDFASGTSSRSTKLIHGGVRYLQKAILGLDIGQFRMVTEALAERANLIAIAPHLAYPLPIMLPVYKFWQIPYFWVGIKAYDIVAGLQTLKPSYFLSKYKALELFPMLKANKLCGALVYYDGMHEDARMCLTIAMTAARLGANVVNHVKVVELVKTEDGHINGAIVEDTQTGDMWTINAKCVINATGPHTDFVRQLDSPEKPNICQPSSGTHIILPSYYSPAQMGLLDPSTSDGRIIFFLPWQNSTMAGTTDFPCTVCDNPHPTEEEIQFILNEIKNYLNPDVNVRRGDVLSAWSGIRPLVSNPNAADTQSIARNHIIEISNSKLITIAGGKWTTYRSMAEETIDEAIRVCNLEPIHLKSSTKGLLLTGAHNWTPTLFIRLIQEFGLDSQIAQHLANTYGDSAMEVAELAKRTGRRYPVIGKRLHEDYPYIEAEVHYAASREYACRAVDVIARRTRLAFLNSEAAESSLDRIVQIMAENLDWSDKRIQEETARGKRFLRIEMGLNLKRNEESSRVSMTFEPEEVAALSRQFQSIDSKRTGFVTLSELKRSFVDHGIQVTEDKLHSLLDDIDISKNAQLDMNEFLQLMSVLKNEGALLAKASTNKKPKISVDRSGGGV